MLRRLGLAAALAALAAGGFALAQDDAAAPEGPVDARLISATGEVFVISRESPEEGVPADPDNPTPLEAGDKVRTGADASAEIGLEGESVLELGPESEFTVTSLQREEPSFLLGFGSMMAKIKRLFTKEGRFVVRTPNAVAAVRGTEFGVEVAEDEGQTHVAVFDEGKVAVTSDDGLGETLLQSNHETLVRRGVRPVKAERLKHFLKHRQRMKLMRGRLAGLRGRWQRMPPARRAEMRRKLRDRYSSMRPEDRERFKDRLRQLHERRKDIRERNRERMEDRRERRQERRQEGGPGGQELRDKAREQMRERRGDFKEERERRRRDRKGRGDDRRGHPGGKR